jgi:2-amino-4-hydroxy-6-hydroxymethyldihydropteridine diphosphokinase
MNNYQSIMSSAHIGIFSRGRHAFIALGSNAPHVYREPEAALQHALERIEALGLHVEYVSRFFRTQAVGGGRQPNFVNAVACIDAAMAPAALLRVLKRLERDAGRRLGRPWGPRPLDLDILFSNRTIGEHAQPRRRTGCVILPHPEMHRRAFVLVPLVEIAPHWSHPVLNRTVRNLLHSPRIRAQLRTVTPMAHRVTET